MAKTKKSDDEFAKVGARIRELRIKKGYTSAESFAYDHELNRVQYWRMERGTNLTLKALFRILRIHKLHPEEFFKGMKV